MSVIVTCKTRQGDASPLGAIRRAVRCLLAQYDVSGGVCMLTTQQPAETDMVLTFSVVVYGHPVVYSAFLVPERGGSASTALHADLTRSILESDRGGGHCCCGGSGPSGKPSLIFVRREGDPEVVGQFGPDWRDDSILVRRLLLRLFQWWPRDETCSDPDDDGLQMVGYSALTTFLGDVTGLRSVGALIRGLCESGVIEGIRNPACNTVAWYRMKVDELTRTICSGDRHESCAMCTALAS